MATNHGKTRRWFLKGVVQGLGIGLGSTVGSMIVNRLIERLPSSQRLTLDIEPLTLGPIHFEGEIEGNLSLSLTVAPLEPRVVPARPVEIITT